MAPGRIHPHYAEMLEIGEAAFPAGAGSAVEIAVRVGLWLAGGMSSAAKDDFSWCLISQSPVGFL
jgi:hypothetical protein